MNYIKGQKVHYIPFDGAEIGLYENGIIKSICVDENYVFVVYNWDGISANYEDYTAARTNINQLNNGWIYSKKLRK